MQNSDNQEWIVKWENGKTMRFVPYDSFGMSSFIKKGLSLGIVTINDKEVFWVNDFDGWKYKE